MVAALVAVLLATALHMATATHCSGDVRAGQLMHSSSISWLMYVLTIDIRTCALCFQQSTKETTQMVSIAWLLKCNDTGTFCFKAVS